MAIHWGRQRETLVSTQARKPKSKIVGRIVKMITLSASWELAKHVDMQFSLQQEKQLTLLYVLSSRFGLIGQLAGHPVCLLSYLHEKNQQWSNFPTFGCETNMWGLKSLRLHTLNRRCLDNAITPLYSSDDVTISIPEVCTQYTPNIKCEMENCPKYKLRFCQIVPVVRIHP